MKHSTRVQFALARLPEVDPAIAALALWCTFRDGEGPTRTVGETIFVGPGFALLPISEQTGLIAHHVLHVALRHSARRNSAQERYGTSFHPTTYDLACDALVNEALLQGGHALPRPAVRAADLIDFLPKDQKPENVLTDWDSERLYRSMTEAPRQGAATPDDGIDGYIRNHAFEPDIGSAHSDQTDGEIWVGRIEQALSAGQRAGSGIGSVISRFGDLPKPVVPWEVKLRRLLNKALVQHPSRTHRRPARAWLARDALARQMQGAQPVFEPGMVRDQRRPRLVVGLDTSSSIGRQTLSMFASEVISIVRKTGAEAHVLGFDTEVHSRHQLGRVERFEKLILRTGGGTDFQPFLLEAQTLDPSLIIVLTDLEADTRQLAPAPVLWVVPRKPSIAPSFGEMLVMDDL